MNKTDILAIRIEPDLKRDFQKAANTDSRTTANALIVAIKDYIKKMEEKPI
jgi:predicted DNA-binding protein